MSKEFWCRTVTGAAASIALCCTANLLGQAGTQGNIAVTVTDASNAGVVGASLELTSLSTNAVHHSKTEGKGTFNFVGLPIGVYSLSVAQPGFQTTVIGSVVVQASQTTPVTVALQLGNASETVNVEAVAAPLIDSTSNSIGQVLDLKAIENLPLYGRDLTSLTRLTAGYSGTTGPNGDGIWNGQPLASQGVNIDGVVGAPSRGKYDGNVQASASPRVENIAEMAIQTDQIDLDQGFGRSTMQVNYVTRSGTNQFHGRAYLDARNSGLNANTYSNNVAGLRRTKLIYNDFGGSVGGPILHDKLFFFGSFATLPIPGGTTTSNSYLPTSAQAGNFTYVDTTGQSRTVNLYQLAGRVGAPTTMNAAIASQLALINKSLTSGNSVTTSDPNINTLSWNEPTPTKNYWPTFRLDWNTSNKLHTYVAANMSQTRRTGLFLPSTLR